MLSASDLNGEFNNIVNNGEDLGWPATKSKDMDGQSLLLDSDADSHFTADTDDRLDLALSGTDLFRWDGTVTTPINGLDFIASAAGSAVRVQSTGSDTDITLNLQSKGAGAVQVNGVDIAGSSATTAGEDRRRAALAHFQVQTARGRLMEIWDNQVLSSQVFG